PAALAFRVRFDAGKVQLGGATLDVEHAHVHAVGGDDLPPAWVEHPVVVGTLNIVVPALDRGNVLTHRSLVQLEAELAIGIGSWPSCHVANHGVDVPGYWRGHPTWA